MACINCDNCSEVLQLVPKCYAGSITFSTGHAPATAFTVITEKYNGSKIESQITTDGAGDLIASLQDLADEAANDWFQPGAYKIAVLDSNREPVTLTDGVTETTCLLFKVTGVEVSSDVDIIATYA